MNSVKTLNPFRAGSGLFPSCLAGRRLLLELFSSRLYSTITGSPRNVLVFGNKKIGKTCLLNQMENISSDKKLLTVSTISAPETLKSFIENLAVRIHAEVKNGGLLTNGCLHDLLLELQSFPSDVNPAELEIVFIKLISKVWENIETKVPAIFISIDDIDLVGDSAKALLFIHHVTQNLYKKNCPVIFVVSAALEFYEQVKKKHSKLVECFEPIFASKLQPSSCENSIRVPLWELEVAYDESVVKEIARLSDGFPFYLQHIGHYVFDEMQTEFDTLALRRGYEKAMQYLKRDVFAPLEQDLPLNERTIYLSIYKTGIISFSDLLKKLKLPRGSVASSLKRLREKQLISQDKKKYRVNDKLFGEYLDKKFKKENGISNGSF